MAKHATPSRREIDELLLYLPFFADATKALQVHDRGGTLREDEPLALPAQSYAPEVLAFFSAASQPCWTDYGYEESSACAMIESFELISKADWDEIRSLLTLCVRGERFCDGFWGELIKGGTIARILRRIQRLRDGAD